MFQAAAAVRQSQCVVAGVGSVGVRYRSRYSRETKKVIWHTGERTVPSNQPAAWSTGEVQHPGRLDCPLGNKGEYPKPMSDGGQQYFGFQYYPRHPDQKDPPYEPTPLHLVTRTRCLKKKPWWDKEIMEKLGLAGKRSDVIVVKNNPETNAMLWKVKHMVKVTPIKIPGNDLSGVDPRCCFLKENGEFVVTPTIKVDDGELEEDPKFVAQKWDGNFINKHTRPKWEHPWQLKVD